MFPDDCLMPGLRRMNLPNYFLADLPPDSPLHGWMIRDACQALKRNRVQYLAGRTTESLVGLLGELGANWMRPNDALRRHALEVGPSMLRFSRPTIERGLDSFFSELTADNLRALMVQDLGHAHRFDSPVASAVERTANRVALVRGPELIAHITAGNVPNPALMSMVLGLLTRSAQFVKCAQGSSLLPRLFAHSIHEADPKIASCIELAEWAGGTSELETALFAEAECVTVTGSDETLEDIRRRLPLSARFLGYGQRMSFGFITREVLSGATARRIARFAAADVAAWDQQGCLSPHVFYVESSGSISPSQFAALLAEELAVIEAEAPRGELSLEEATRIALQRDFYRVRSAVGSESHDHLATELWCSEGATAWTVVYEDEPRFHTSSLNRFIHVKRASGLVVALQHAEVLKSRISTVGIAANEERARELTPQLARWGVPRICAIGRMQRPPLLWRHDGRPALADLVTWTDWEQEPPDALS
jgi:hypothetical protein